MIKKYLSNIILILKNKGLIKLLLSFFYFFLIEIYKEFFPKKFIKKRILKFKMFLNPFDKGISRTLILFGEREIDHLVILRKILKKNMRIFDIGANIGYYILLQRQFISKSSKIIAIEPLKDNVDLLNLNLELNNEHNTIVLHGGVSNTTGKKKFYKSEHSNLGTFNPLKAKSNKDFISIKTFKLTDLFNKYFYPDIIRMDVEGHEVEIFDNLTKSKLKKYPMICFETHLSKYQKNNKMNKNLNKLFQIGYKVKIASSSSEHGTKILEKLGYISDMPSIKTDDVKRKIFFNIKNKDAINLICTQGGLRTILLSKN